MIYQEHQIPISQLILGFCKKDKKICKKIERTTGSINYLGTENFRPQKTYPFCKIIYLTEAKNRFFF